MGVIIGGLSIIMLECQRIVMLWTLRYGNKPAILRFGWTLFCWDGVVGHLWDPQIDWIGPIDLSTLKWPKKSVAVLVVPIPDSSVLDLYHSWLSKGGWLKMAMGVAPTVLHPFRWLWADQYQPPFKHGILTSQPQSFLRRHPVETTVTSIFWVCPPFVVAYMVIFNT